MGSDLRERICPYQSKGSWRRLRMRRRPFKLLRIWFVLCSNHRLAVYNFQFFTAHQSKAEGGSLGWDLICMNAYVLTKVRDLGDVCACVGGHLSYCA